ncbi:serine protease 33-like [Enhydra lutris kenyoni]|uniref:Serine protease 33-like n=1 Tax=Enhydra lutris kenyoni TaxID=391180 RepID=A0A2Y9KI32_ENHLU|nr:serine protease 33-like [Enhydra lutris kenyoni]
MHPGPPGTGKRWETKREGLGVAPGQRDTMPESGATKAHGEPRVPGGPRPTSVPMWLLPVLLMLPFLGERGSGFSPEARIVGGAAVVPRQWPWQVSLRDRGQHVCGGSLIGHQWVLTAAHCVSSSTSLQDLRVQLGEAALYSRPRGSISVAVVRAIQHPFFTGDALQGGDVALVKLARPVPFSSTIRPIALAPPGADFPAGSLCWVTGWGDIQQDVALPEPRRLQEADVRVVGLDSCHRLYYPEPITKNMLCAGDVQGQKGFCEGDSGGPLVCQLRDRRWVQAAVVSFSRGCAEPGLPRVYARVSSYWAWIQRHLLPPGHFRRNFRRG